jgi:FSR family fosmidomycin resistance protein-like MFS transporter
MQLSPTLFLVATGHFINDIYMGFLAPLYPLIMEKFNLSLSLVGTISMVAALASALSQPLFGMLFDRYGASIALYLAPLVTGVFVSLMGAAPSFPLFLAVLFIGCLGSAAFHPTGASVTPSLSGKHPEVGMALFSAGGNLGFAAGPAVIAFFIAAFGYQASPMLALPAVAVAMALFFLLPIASLREKTRRAARISWRDLFADKRQSRIVLRLVFINFCLTVGIRGMQTFLPIHLASGGMPLTSIGILFTVMLALGALISIWTSAISRTAGRRPLILASILAGVPLFLLGVLLLPSPPGSILIVLSGVALTSSNPILILFAQTYSGNSPAMASSLLMGLSWGIAGLAMVPLGILGELIGVKSMLVLASLFPLLGIVACLRVPNR